MSVLLLAALGSASAAPLVAIPAGRDSDLRYFAADGTQLEGLEALRKMPGADLNLWVAGNQFFAMDRVIGDFRQEHPKLSIGLVTLPPGLEEKAIVAGGWSWQGEDFAFLPDVYATLGLDMLRATGRVRSYVTYMHNAIELMVARGNPDDLRDLNDLARPGLRLSLPNPLTEGIMSTYAKPILIALGLWGALSGGQDCMACEPVPGVWFTSVHHRETPARIAAGKSDAGIVWRTETLAARAAGVRVEGVTLPAGQNAMNRIAYVAAALTGAPHDEAAQAYLDFITSPRGQAAYASFGFLPADADERLPADLPPG